LIKARIIADNLKNKNLQRIEKLELKIVAKNLLAKGVYLGEVFGAGGDRIDISDRRYNQKVLNNIKETDNLNKIRIQNPIISQLLVVNIKIYRTLVIAFLVEIREKD
jgi:hypothetical protein